ncbi:MAG: hypothetical protein U0174_24665 [Polyangiaceae bacterium]
MIRANASAKEPISGVHSIHGLSLNEALSYLERAHGDEIQAAYALAVDRNALDGSVSDPDDAEVHHSLFLLRRARGLAAPSFDQLRLQLRSRAA